MHSSWWTRGCEVKKCYKVIITGKYKKDTFDHFFCFSSDNMMHNSYKCKYPITRIFLIPLRVMSPRTDCLFPGFKPSEKATNRFMDCKYSNPGLEMQKRPYKMTHTDILLFKKRKSGWGLYYLSLYVLLMCLSQIKRIVL